VNEKIKIGGHCYRLLFVEQHEFSSLNRWAEIDYRALTIKIDKHLHGTRLYESIAHEILHGLIIESGVNSMFDKKEVDHEEFNGIMENTFFQFLLDNTNFFDDVSH